MFSRHKSWGWRYINIKTKIKAARTVTHDSCVEPIHENVDLIQHQLISWQIMFQIYIAKRLRKCQIHHKKQFNQTFENCCSRIGWTRRSINRGIDKRQLQPILHKKWNTICYGKRVLLNAMANVTADRSSHHFMLQLFGKVFSVRLLAKVFVSKLILVQLLRLNKNS